MTERIYSHSAVKLFQRCQLRWKYRYIDRLESKDKPKYFERGSTLHELLEEYHTYDTSLSLSLMDASDEDRDVIFRYDLKWEGEEEWEVLHAEEEFHMDVHGYKFVYIPDLVVRIGEDVWIVDHKTTANIPDEWDEYNMTDWQHLLYIHGMREHYDNVRGFIFNYIRTKAPSQPTLIKDGTRISAVRKMDTDYNTLKQFAEDNGVMDEDTKDKLNILRHSPDRYFQRHYIIAPDIAVLQAKIDAGSVLDEMIYREAHGGPYPRHVVAGFAGAMACSKCEFQPLCHGELLGINTDVVLLNYIERPRKEDT